jgi:hypothetical protein
METVTPYLGDAYWSWPQIEAWLEALADANPSCVRLSTIGTTAGGRNIRLITLGAIDGTEDDRPAFWLDGGTHAAEWTGVMATLYAISKWLPELGDDWFAHNAIHVVPCISPDGYQALLEGKPHLRSTLRGPAQGRPRSGLDPADLDGDGVVRQMRWRHPAGPYVQDAEQPLFMRRRRLDDDPADAFFVCQEGHLVNWDGHRWTQAALAHGLDLNRNFPSQWAPFEMFGMDGGRFPGSVPESRSLLDAWAARPRIGAAVSNHTYTGALLCQPYRADSPMGKHDLRLVQRLAEEAVEGTGWRAIRVHPDFTYDPKKPIRGVWSDTISTVFGVPGYTLELWDPFAHCGVDEINVAGFLTNPKATDLRALFNGFADSGQAWTAFEHPQLGAVEIGGLDLMRTLRNPPEALLSAQCDRAWLVADRLRRSLPQVRAQVTCTAASDGVTQVELLLANHGCLGTGGLKHGEGLVGTPGVSAELIIGRGLTLIQGEDAQALGHLDGWGTMLAEGGHSIYAELPSRGHRVVARWWVRGHGPLQISWQGGRGGRGGETLTV